MSDTELKELVASLAVSQKETDRQMKETDQKIKEMSAAIDRHSGNIGREWGAMVEALTKASCLEQMRDAGIHVTQTAKETESERPGFEQEWDNLLVNGEELVAIEVKSRFQAAHLKRIEKKLLHFKKAFPQYAGYKVYGGVAAIKYDAHSDSIAEKHGLFVFKPSGEIMRLVNHTGFRPKAY